MIEQIKLAAVVLSFLLPSCSGGGGETVFSWVEENRSAEVEGWLKNSGNPDLRTEQGCSLLYLATGPHGGNDVLRVLTKHGANVNEGCGQYTPLMNAASWVNQEAVMLLLEAGADPRLENENGHTAIDVIGRANAEDERRIREALLRALDGGE